MANTFKNSVTGSIGTTTTTVYETPSATSTTVIGVSVANIISQNINVSVQITDNSLSRTIYLVKDAVIPVGSQAVLVGGEQKVVLEANDYIRVTSNQASSADVIVSVLELS